MNASEVVRREYRTFYSGAWSQWLECTESDVELFRSEYPETHEVRELIVKPSHSPAVVAWRFVYSDDSGQWYPGAPTEGILEGARQAGSGIQLAYSQPAAQVPDEVMEALDRVTLHVCTRQPDGSDVRAAAILVARWAKSIGGGL